MRYSPTRLANTVFQIEMPQRPPEMAGAAVADLLKVSVLGKSTNQVWTAIEDVEWLVNYVATEVAMGGVPQVEAAAAAEGNCEVEGLRVQWNFGAESWRAEFVTGKLQGTAAHSSVSKNEFRKMCSRVYRSCGGI